MDKLNISSYCAVKNGEPWIRKALLSVDFCDQRILLDDSSTDNTVQIAEELGWEVYHWEGPNSMCERRNFAINWEGNKDIKPFWIASTTLQKDHPVIKHDWILQVDHDEVFASNTEIELKKFLENKEKEKKYNGLAFYLRNIYTEGQYAGKQMTTIPLTRLFRNGHVHWEQDIQNDVVYEGDTGWIGTVLNHYGYGSWEQHWEKQWNRLVTNEERVRNNPDDLASRAYLINALSVTGERDVINFDRLLANVAVALDNPKEYKHSMSGKLIVERIVRHFWTTCMNNNTLNAFMFVLNYCEKYIDWIADIHYWKIICAFRQDPVDISKIDEYGREFLKKMMEFKRPPIKNIELQSIDEEISVCKQIYTTYLQFLYIIVFSKDHKDNTKLLFNIAKSTEFWRKKCLLYDFYKRMERERSIPSFLLFDIKQDSKHTCAVEYIFGDDIHRESIMNIIKKAIN